MGTRYSHLSLAERHQIARLRDAKLPVAEIARRLDRHVATVHRELRHNRTDAGAWLRGYFAVAAQTISDFRMRTSVRTHTVKFACHLICVRLRSLRLEMM